MAIARAALPKRVVQSDFARDGLTAIVVHSIQTIRVPEDLHLAEKRRTVVHRRQLRSAGRRRLRDQSRSRLKSGSHCDAIAIPATTAAVRWVRNHDCRSPRIRGGPTGLRGSMPRVRSCRYVLAQLLHSTRAMSPITGSPQLVPSSPCGYPARAFDGEAQNALGRARGRRASSRRLGAGMRPSRCACFRASLRARRMASAFSRVLRSEGFS
jgi:hypothetical protein